MTAAVIPEEVWDAAVTKETVTTSAPWTLRTGDRCDRCGAQAFVRAQVVVEVEPGVSGPVALHFCGHHYRKHADAIRAVASSIVDERARINERPTPVD